jgi:hypothetical protein
VAKSGQLGAPRRFSYCRVMLPSTLEHQIQYSTVQYESSNASFRWPSLNIDAFRPRFKPWAEGSITEAGRRTAHHFKIGSSTVMLLFLERQEEFVRDHRNYARYSRGLPGTPHPWYVLYKYWIFPPRTCSPFIAYFESSSLIPNTFVSHK